MKTGILKLLFVTLIITAANMAGAATVRFNSTECPSCVNTQAVVGNEWAAYGLSVTNAYWYTDNRDTFDQMGLSVNQTTGTASIAISPLSNGISFDYWVIGGNRGVYEAFDGANNSLGTLNIDATQGDVLGSYSYFGNVQRLEFSGSYGVVQVSTLTVTGVIPEPETYAMMLAGLGLLGFAARRRKQHAA